MSHREIFRKEGLPVLQNRVFRTREEALAGPIGDVVLVQNQQTGLIYNEAFDASKLVYDENYQNEQAHSDVFKRHLEQVAAIVQKHLRGKKIIEVGCGKGYFLEILRSRGNNITGIDPAYEGTNPNVVRAPFTKELGLSGEGLILRHVLEHIPDPFRFLNEIALANGRKGTIFIEVPTFDWIVGHRVWFDIFYEHVNYFRLSDLMKMFGTVYESGVFFGGQYCYVLADLASLRTPAYTPSSDDVRLPDDFQDGIQDALAVIRKFPRRKLAIWGGGSKGVIYSIYLKDVGVTPDFVIDVNPVKQGCFLAVTGLKVSSPEQALKQLSAGDNLFVMNSNYRDEIIAQSGNRFTYMGVERG